MKLKIIKPIYNKEKLYKIALQKACAELVINCEDFLSIQQARQKMIREAKKSYNN